MDLELVAKKVNIPEVDDPFAQFGELSFDKMMLSRHNDLHVKIYQEFNALNARIRTRKWAVDENKSRFESLVLESFKEILKGDKSPQNSLYALLYHLDMGAEIDVSVDGAGMIRIASDNDFVSDAITFMIREFGIRMEIVPFDPFDIFRYMYPWNPSE